MSMTRVMRNDDSVRLELIEKILQGIEGLPAWQSKIVSLINC